MLRAGGVKKWLDQYTSPAPSHGCWAGPVRQGSILEEVILDKLASKKKKKGKNKIM